MEKKLENWIGSINFISNGERTILNALASEADTTGLCLSSIKDIQTATGYASETVKIYLSSLRKKMIISTYTHRIKPPFELNLNYYGGDIE